MRDTMGRLALTLLGGFQARLSTGPVLTLPVKAQALLVYFAVHPGALGLGCLVAVLAAQRATAAQRVPA